MTMRKKEAISQISSILKYLLINYKNRVLAMSYTQQRSRVVACIDFILETEKEANYVK